MVGFQQKLKKFGGKAQDKIVEQVLLPYRKVLEKINEAAPNVQNLSDEELKSYSRQLKTKVYTGTNVDDILVEAFALVREVCDRTLAMRPYDVQVLAALVLHEGNCAEMKTGEGKTLAAVMPAYLNALEGKGVHILTFNDYLAKRDADWMGPAFEFLGLTVGFLQERMSNDEKRSAYHCDITYATAKMIGFDYLRSFIAYEKEEIILRPFHFSIIDEADALLIDEARNPLVLAGNISETEIDLAKVASVVSMLEKEKDYTLDEFLRNIFLNENGIEKVEKQLSLNNLFSQSNFEWLSAVNLALHAKDLLHKDIDYIVKNGEVKLVDEFTGRIVEDRKWRNGLQMAVEAKEQLEIQSEGSILGSISLPHFMQLYPKKAGMTATALSSADEFLKFYNLRVVIIPPNIPCNRIDQPDLVFTHKEAKNGALVKEIIQVHRTGRPILIGTLTVKESEELANRLKQHQLKFQVLNAKNDELEAAIIANAGALGAITISTNMAGRGTDILLGGKNEKDKLKVIELGGLYVIGTNRHESLRIDNQLRGRAGRQGDPGSSRFFISFEDDLMVRYKLNTLFPKSFVAIQQDTPIDHNIVKKRINLAQKIIEGQMQEQRETLNEYSKFIEKQRLLIQGERQDILLNKTFADQKIKDFILHFYDKFWATHLHNITEMRDGIHFVRLGGRNPLRVFHEQADEHFNFILEEIKNQVDDLLTQTNEDLKDKKIMKPSSTWTYVINDNPFGNQLSLMLSDNSNIGMQIDIFTAPILFLMGLVRKFKNRK